MFIYKNNKSEFVDVMYVCNGFPLRGSCHAVTDEV